MFSSVIFVLLVFCHNFQSFQTFDKLEFWSGNSEPKRRAYDLVKKKESNDTPFRYIKVPVEEKKNRNGTDPHIDLEFRTLVPAQYRAHDNHHFDKEKNNKWPKVQHKYKQRQSADVRSTRLTPAYLMQQENDHTKITTTATEDPENEIPLSPYSLKDNMLQLTKSCFPEANVTVDVIGRTASFNDIVILKATAQKYGYDKYFRADDRKYIDEVPEKRIIFIVHGLSTMGLRNLPCLKYRKQFKQLLSYYFNHLDKFDIFLIPIANPDGLSHSGSWNKNMSPQGACAGVALDRNFDIMFNNTHTISSCSQRYPGITPFSEPETRAIRDILHHYSHKIHAYFHVHSCCYNHNNFKGDAVLYPKGYTDIQTDDDKYIDLHGEIDEAMKNASFQIISVTMDTLHSWYGTVTGTSVDYASTVYGIPYAMELVMQLYRDDGSSREYSVTALEEIWKRVIDVIFNNIWRNVKNNEV